jgi:hypothetical protein
MLSASAKKVVDEVIAQLERSKDALQGVEATIIERELAYRRGEVGVKQVPEKRRVPAKKKRDVFDPDGMLAQAERLKAQAQRRIDALQQGEFVVKETREEQWSPAEEALDSVGSPYEVLTSSKRTLEELPSNERNEIRIRAAPAETKFDFANFPGEDNLAFILTMSREPARLLKVEAELVNVPWWFKWLLKSMEVRIEFDYIRSVPVPKTSFTWIQSRGIGPWRIEMGDEVEVRYTE